MLNAKDARIMTINSEQFKKRYLKVTQTKLWQDTQISIIDHAKRGDQEVYIVFPAHTEFTEMFEFITVLRTYGFIIEHAGNNNYIVRW